jgi:hypothetical protein
MLADTLIAAFLIPVSFYVVERLAGRGKEGVADSYPPEPATNGVGP